MQNQRLPESDEEFYRKKKIKILDDIVEGKIYFQIELKQLRRSGQDDLELQNLVDLANQSIRILKQMLNQK